MGAKSTIDITREQALNKIYSMLDDAPDEAVSDVLETLNDYCGGGLGCHNFYITSEPKIE